MPGPVSTADWLMTIGGALLCAAGLVMFLANKREKIRLFVDRYARSASEMSVALIGMALVLTGYHLIVYGVGFTALRMPLGIAIGVSVLTILGTTLADSLEGRGERDD